MDDPGLDEDRHRHALVALARVNRVSLAARRVSREVVAIASARPGRVRVLDIACGGGDVLRGVAAGCDRAGIGVDLHGCDVSPVALSVAKEVTAGDGRFDFFSLDALSDPIPGGYDLVGSSLFLHHLSFDEAATLLARTAEVTEHAVLHQDLRRTRLGYLFAFIGLHTLTRSDVARADGLRSVRAAFAMSEGAALCSEAGLTGAEIRPCWPQRFTIRWSK